MNTDTAVSTIAEIPEKDQEVLSIVEVAKSLTIRNNEEYLFVDQFLVKTAALKKRIIGRWEKAKKAAKAAHAAICDSEGAELGLAEEAYGIAKQLKHVYEAKKEAERLAEEKRLNDIARAKAEAEQKEVNRLAQIEIDKQAAIAAEAAKKAEAEGNKRAAQKILDDAVAAETKARQEAEEAKNRPVYVEPVKLSKDVPQSLTRSQVRWSATVGGTRDDGSTTNPLFVLIAVKAALLLLSKAKTPAGIKAYTDLAQAEKDLGFMEYNQQALNGVAKAGSPYVNGVLKLGGVVFVSRKV